MYEYDLIPTNDYSILTYINLFTQNWGDYPYDVTQYIPQQYESRALPHFCAAIEKSSQEVVGVMGILNITENSEPMMEYPGEDWYKFSHLVVSDAHRHQGIGVGIIRMATKFLIQRLGAVGIVNWKKINVLPNSIFLQLGFEEAYFDPDEIDYIRRYELEAAGVDLTELNRIWGEYDVRS